MGFLDSTWMDAHDRRGPVATGVGVPRIATAGEPRPAAPILGCRAPPARPVRALLFRAEGHRALGGQAAR
ncbi:MAG TPA: hypothetical protein PLU22_19815, partial [Polyangiaceae bacterium]|nr:hypothetical protein [Polyangiaceae bacterium]